MLANSGHVAYAIYVMISSGNGKIKIPLAEGSVFLPGNKYCLREFTLQGRKGLRGQVEFMCSGLKPVNHTRSSTDQSINLTCLHLCSEQFEAF